MQRTTRRYSIFSLIREARRQHTGWGRAWTKAVPENPYDVAIVGGGAHGLATAYYLAKRHNIRNVAVLEKARIGGGNAAGGAAIVRSSYLRPQSMALYGLSHRLFEGLARELRFNPMFAPRGLVEVATSAREFDRLSHVADANRNFGLASWMIPAEEARALLPPLGPDITLLGALWQPRGGLVQEAPLNWAYARRASYLHVDIIEDCAALNILTEGGRVTGLETSRGTIRANKVLLADEDTSSRLANAHGVELPLGQAEVHGFASEPLKPLLNPVVLANGMGSIMQSASGELIISGPPSAVAQPVEDIMVRLLELFPSLGGARLLRQWSRRSNITRDGSPLIGPIGPTGLYVNAGWADGGIDAVPGSGLITAAMLATGTPHPIAVPFSPDRFASGQFVNERQAHRLAS